MSLCGQFGFGARGQGLVPSLHFFALLAHSPALSIPKAPSSVHGRIEVTRAKRRVPVLPARCTTVLRRARNAVLDGRPMAALRRD